MENEETTDPGQTPGAEKFLVAMLGFAAAFVAEEVVKKGAKAAIKAYRNR